MKTSELYLIVSVTLFCLSFGIIPVGGMCESNPNHDLYFYGFAFTEINLFISFIVLAISNYKQNKQ